MLAQPQDCATAEAKLQEAHTLFTRSLGPAHKEVRDCAQALVNLHLAWHAVEPGNGYDQQAAEWKAKLAPLAPEPKKGDSK